MLRHLALGLIWASPLWADPTAPEFQDPVVELEYGVFCDSESGERVPAPDTELGYIELAPQDVKISMVRQKLPAEIGLAFGVIPHVSRDVNVVVKVHRPDRATPESWDGTLWKDQPGSSYFTFDFPQEQVPGLWAMEAWEGDRRLYRVEYLVTPPGSDPALSGFCNLTS